MGHVPTLVWLLVTTNAASIVQASEISRSPANASREATVVNGEGAAPTLHPSTIVSSILPATCGGVVSSTLITWTISTLVFIHASVTLYVRVMTIGHVPLTVWLLDTARSPSAVQASAMLKVPGSASSAATVMTGAGASVAVHPSMEVVVILPETAGAVASSTYIVCTISTLVLSHSSVTLYVREITTGQVPLVI